MEKVQKLAQPLWQYEILKSYVKILARSANLTGNLYFGGNTTLYSILIVTAVPIYILFYHPTNSFVVNKFNTNDNEIMLNLYQPVWVFFGIVIIYNETIEQHFIIFPFSDSKLIFNPKLSSSPFTYHVYCLFFQGDLPLFNHLLFSDWMSVVRMSHIQHFMFFQS